MFGNKYLYLGTYSKYHPSDFILFFSFFVVVVVVVVVVDRVVFVFPKSLITDNP